MDNSRCEDDFYKKNDILGTTQQKVEINMILLRGKLERSPDGSNTPFLVEKSFVVSSFMSALYFIGFTYGNWHTVRGTISIPIVPLNGRFGIKMYLAGK